MLLDSYDNKKAPDMQPIAAFSFLFARPRPVPERKPSRLRRLVRRAPQA
jgi:hypothetical protein